MKASVCIPGFRAATIDTAVRSILQQTYADWQLIVTGQGPEAGEIERVVSQLAADRDFRVILDSAPGKCAALNAAVAASSGDVLAFIDDDCEADPGWLEVIVAKLRATPEVGAIGGPLVPPPRTKSGRGFCPFKTVEAESIYRPTGSETRLPDDAMLIGCNTAIRRRVLDVVGPFDEHLGPGTAYASDEDVDMSFRMVRSGIVIMITPEAIVHHTHGWRYGTRTIWNMHRSYCAGIGAGHAKMTLRGLDAGRDSLAAQRRQLADCWAGRRNPLHLPMDSARYCMTRAAYRTVVRDYELDAYELLSPRPGVAH